MAYPSTISTLTNPNPTDKLNSPSHSSVHGAENTAINEIQRFVGTDASALGTLVYDIRSANSNGGGHVQTANKGGTGQTAYAKGDVLVASSSSVLTKVSLGTTGQALVVDPNAFTGLSYQGVATAQVIQNQTYTYARASVMSSSVYGVNLGQAVSVLSDGLAFNVKFPTNNATSVVALSINAQGPSSLTALLKNFDGTNFVPNNIRASMVSRVVFDSISSIFQMSPFVPPYLGDTTQYLRSDGQFGSVLNSFVLGVQTSSVIIGQTISETSLMSVSIPASTIAANTGVKGRLFINAIGGPNAGQDLNVRLYLGSSSLISAGSFRGASNGKQWINYLDFSIIGDGSSSAQITTVNFPSASVIGDLITGSNRTTFDTGAAQTLTVRTAWGTSTGLPTTSLTMSQGEVDKIL